MWIYPALKIQTTVKYQIRTKEKKKENIAKCNCYYLIGNEKLLKQIYAIKWSML